MRAVLLDNGIGVEKVFRIVSDNGSNIVCAFKKGIPEEWMPEKPSPISTTSEEDDPEEPVQETHFGDPNIEMEEDGDDFWTTEEPPDVEVAEFEEAESQMNPAKAVWRSVEIFVLCPHTYVCVT